MASYSNPQQQAWGGPFPALHMWPVHETFAMKMIHLPEGQRIKVGRQTNAKSTPGERNAFFDSKVLSRLHAEIWEQGGKIYIKDIKSSNGTFVNQDRLSPEGMESDPYELKSKDIVEFGIDIISEDNRTIVHHKVAAKVFCVFTAEDAALSAREMVYLNRRNQPQAPPQPTAFSSGGKANGATFDHVLAKLQAELARSKDTESELKGLSTTMTDIQDTLGGGLPPAQNGAAADFIPPQYRSAQAALDGQHGQQAAAYLALQNQLTETQTSLNLHIDRIRTLETNLEQHQTVRLEIAQMRQEMETSRRDMEVWMSKDDDDAKSVSTVMDNRSKAELAEENVKLADRVQALSTEVSEAAQLSRSLQSQHDEAMAALRALTQRVDSLESGIAQRIASAVSESDKKWEVWRKAMQDGWNKERETWDKERERMQSVVRDWEEASRRAYEEEEERQLNAPSSSSDDVKSSKTRKPRRRRTSNRGKLAVQALREMADDQSSTPKLSAMHEQRLTREAKTRSVTTSSASSSQSGETLHEQESRRSKRPRERPAQSQSVPIVAVLMVAAVAGAWYIQHNKD